MYRQIEKSIPCTPRPSASPMRARRRPRGRGECDEFVPSWAQRPQVTTSNRDLIAEARLNPRLPVRELRHRRLQSLRSCGCCCCGRGPRQLLQPARHPRRVRPRQDPPPARDRQLRAEPLPVGTGPVCQHRGIHQRRHQRDRRPQDRRTPAQVPRGRRAPGRRHPVPRAQGGDPERVLPHVQRAAQRQQADRHDVRSATQATEDARGTHAQPIRLGAPDRDAPTRPRNPYRDPAQEGCGREAHRAGRRARVHRQPRRRPTFASSKVPSSARRPSPTCRRCRSISRSRTWSSRTSSPKGTNRRSPRA